MAKNDDYVKELNFKAGLTAQKRSLISSVGVEVAAQSIQPLLAILLTALGRKKFLRMMEEIMEITMKDYEEYGAEIFEEEEGEDE